MPNSFSEVFHSFNGTGFGSYFFVFPLTTISHVLPGINTIVLRLINNIFNFFQRWIRKIRLDRHADCHIISNLISKSLLEFSTSISFTIRENNTGPSTESCGTPPLISTNSVVIPSTTTRCFLSPRKLRIQLVI